MQHRHTTREAWNGFIPYTSETDSHTATHCNTLQHTATTLQQPAPHCNKLQHYNTDTQQERPGTGLCIKYPKPIRTLQHTATHCNTLQHTATHCNTLQHTATHCNTLQHTAIHCNTLQHTATQTHNWRGLERLHVLHFWKRFLPCVSKGIRRISQWRYTYTNMCMYAYTCIDSIYAHELKTLFNVLHIWKRHLPRVQKVSRLMS